MGKIELFKTINENENPFKILIQQLEATQNPKDHIFQLIKYFSSNELLENKFDKINQEYLYYLNNKEDEKIANEIKSYLDNALKIFVENYIPFPLDYVSNKLSIHELFINKIITR